MFHASKPDDNLDSVNAANEFLEGVKIDDLTGTEANRIHKQDTLRK